MYCCHYEAFSICSLNKNLSNVGPVLFCKCLLVSRQSWKAASDKTGSKLRVRKGRFCSSLCHWLAIRNTCLFVRDSGVNQLSILVECPWMNFLQTFFPVCLLSDFFHWQCQNIEDEEDNCSSAVGFLWNCLLSLEDFAFHFFPLFNKTLMCLSGGPSVVNSNLILDHCYFSDLLVLVSLYNSGLFFLLSVFFLLYITIITVMTLMLDWKDDLFAEVPFPPSILKLMLSGQCLIFCFVGSCGQLQLYYFRCRVWCN